MTTQQHEKTIEKTFSYEIERDGYGALWLLQTDKTGRVIYHKVYLFTEGWFCSINDLVRALCILKGWVDDVEERKRLANRLILGCKGVSWNIYYLVKEAIEDKTFL